MTYGGENVFQGVAWRLGLVSMVFRADDYMVLDRCYHGCRDPHYKCREDYQCAEHSMGGLVQMVYDSIRTALGPSTGSQLGNFWSLQV
jgi:hypothetical protein